jgi:hypothetical protein
MSRKKVIGFLVVFFPFFLPIGYFLIEWCFAGGGIKVLYYNFWKYDDNKVRVVEDVNFLFYKEGYSKTYSLNSDYYVAHRILLIPETKTVPINYEYSGEVLVEIYEGNNLLQSTKMNNFNAILRRKEGGDYYGNYLIYLGKEHRYASSVFAFELGYIPFDLIRLKWNRLRDMKIKIAVIKPDKGLKEFCESATLVIIPDLRT